MSEQRGVYGMAGVHVAFGVPTFAQLLSGMMENARRLEATNPVEYESLRSAGAEVAEGLAEAFKDLDPDVVLRVGLHLISATSAPIYLGHHPATALNVMSFAIAQLGGQLPDPAAAPPP